jgi:hypothetical protein
MDTLLLGDVRDAFDHFDADRLSSEQLINYLVQLEARPWAEWSHVRPMSKFQLSRKFKEYGIVSGTIRTGKGDETPKGYHRKAFDAVFARYLPSPPISTRHVATSPAKQGPDASFQLAAPLGCGELETAEKPSDCRGCGDVASSKRGPEHESVADDRNEVCAPPRPKVMRL